VQADEQRITIYVKLLNEGIAVARPTEATRLSDEHFRLLPTPDYNPECEKWEFPPCSIVSAERQRWSSGEILVAVKPIDSQEQEPA
jgi:hypothetical protein